MLYCLFEHDPARGLNNSFLKTMARITAARIKIPITTKDIVFFIIKPEKYRI
jgi:hypothetical protein